MLNPLRPFFYLLAYLVVLYIRPHEYIEAFAEWRVLPTLLIAAFVCWIITQRKSFEALHFRLLPLLAVVMALSVVITGWVGGGIAVLIEFTPVVILFFMLATTIDTLRRLQQVFLTLSVCVALIALHGIDQSWSGIGWTGATLSQETRIRYIGFLHDPNDLAMALVMVLPMSLYLASRFGLVLRVFFYTVAGVVLYAIYLTNSRGAMLAIGAMLLLYGVLRYGVMKSLFIVPLLAAPLLAFAPSRIAEISADEPSAEGRIEAWYHGFQLFFSRPLFGVGNGFFVDTYGGHTAHNSFVLALSELGLIGYFFWFSIIALSWLMLHRLVFSAVPNDMKAEVVREWEALRTAARTLWYGYVGGLACAFFLSRSYVVILYLHLALIVALFQMARAVRSDFPPLLWHDYGAKLVLLCLGSIVGMWALIHILLRLT
jgi:putative inorganic carbon (hco3(-)) transporter